MSYYGYVKRENAAGVNWQEVGANLSNILLEAGAERQAKRDAFDKATREYQDTLNDAPSGDFKTANTFALNHAADASRMRLIQDRLLKSGVMKDRDYTVARQNLTDGTKQLFGLAEEYQAEYTEKMARLKEGKSQELESWLMANIEGLSNLKNAQSYINQEDGSVSIGKLVDGPSGTRVLSKNPNDFMTVNQLRNRYKEKYDKFDVSGTMTMEAERLGTFIDSVRRAGGPEYAGTITKLLDPTMRGTLGPNGEKAVDSFLNMEKDMINGYLEANPLNGLSVLTNTIAINPDTGVPFEPTFDADEAKKDPNKVLIRDDGSGRIEPLLNDKQKKLVFESVQTNFRNKIDREKTITTYQEPKESAAEVAKGTKEDKDKNVVSNVAQLYYGNDAEVKEAEDFLRSINPNIESIDRTKDNVIVTFNDGRAAETLSWKGEDGTLLDQASWVTGSANFFLDDKSKIGNINEVLGKSGIDLTKDFNETSKGFSAGAVEKEQTIQEAYEDYLNEKIDGSRFSYTTETGIVDNANGKMVKDFKASIPAEFELTEVTGYRPETIDRLVKIKKKGGKSLEVDITKPGYDKIIKDFILDNSTSEEDIKRMALTKGVKKKKVRTQVRSTRGSGELD
jgi:hypothetical protein